MLLQKIYRAAEMFFRHKFGGDTASRWEATSSGWLYRYAVVCGLISYVFSERLIEYGLPFLQAMTVASFAQIARPNILYAAGTPYLFAEVVLFFSVQSLGAIAVLRKQQFGA
jgi:hypothetical protein